ncbi:hypothetical protein POM88_015203 [Heracleum sosnowskyi]|uniref:Uncharacterized protein n=1 Tax=Heracleum sosnowskyi TaxID=360622 RepID=A0AAD8IN71_9APIA|nr:hypothetical protein POM88_015203 [Heracleum sosnowskyi]
MSKILMGDEINKFSRSPRFERSEFSMSPDSRHIYLTFPADSTFREEDVSSYFSNYGPVQDVRIPYQQKPHSLNYFQQNILVPSNRSSPEFSEENEANHLPSYS